MKILSDKIDKVKDDAVEKETRDEVKMAGILERLDSIERKMKDKKDMSEVNAVERQKQKERTKNFKDAVGLIDNVPVPDQTRSKSWSEIVEESPAKDEEKRVKEKEKITKHWTKKSNCQDEEREGILQKLQTMRKRKKSEEVKRLVTEEEEREELRLDTPLHNEDNWSWGRK